MDKLSFEEQLELEDLYTQEDIEIKEILDDKDSLPSINKQLRSDIQLLFDKKLKSRLGVDKINIAVMGKMGSSKSTIINGFYQALHGKFTILAKTDNGNETCTRGIKPISLGNQEKSSECPFNYINIIDIFGEENNNYTKEFIESYFNGKVNFSFQLGEKDNTLPAEWEKNFCRETGKLRFMPHVVIYLFDTFDYVEKGEISESLQNFFDWIKIQGVPGFCLGTKIDKLNDFEGDFYSKEIVKLFNRMKENFGFNSVYPIVNYTDLNHTQDDKKDFIYLYILKRAIMLGQEYINYSKEIVEINDQFSDEEKYIVLKTLQMSLEEFGSELAKTFVNDTYTVDLNGEARLDSIKLRDRITPKVGEPYISQILVHKQIEVRLISEKKIAIKSMKVFPLMDVNKFTENLNDLITSSYNSNKVKKYALEDYNEKASNSEEPRLLKDFIIKTENDSEFVYAVKIKQLAYN